MNEFEALEMVRREVAGLTVTDQQNVRLAAQRIRTIARSAAGKLAVQLVHLELLAVVQLGRPVDRKSVV